MHTPSIVSFKTLRPRRARTESGRRSTSTPFAGPGSPFAVAGSPKVCTAWVADTVAGNTAVAAVAAVLRKVRRVTPVFMFHSPVASTSRAPEPLRRRCHCEK